MAWAGYYINLDRSTDRRSSIEGALATAGIGDRYQRFPAVDGSSVPRHGSKLSPGELGCFLSHAGIIDKLSAGDSFTHIVEDDAAISVVFRPAIDQLLATGAFSAFDLIYTDVILTAVPADTLRRIKTRFDQATANGDLTLGIVDLQGITFASTSSYFVNPAAVARLRQLLRSEAVPTLAIDILFNREVQAGRLKAGVIFPFVSCVDLNLSARSTRGDSRSDAPVLHDLLRYAFYVECDVAAARAALDRVPSPRVTDPHFELLMEIQRRMIGG